MRTQPLVGEPMPHFELPSSEGAVVRTRELTGSGPLVLYFYPKDETLGCTIESCAFRDRHPEFTAAGARVFGISPDTVESHLAFAQHHRLPFALLSDPGERVFALYGVRRLLGRVPGRETFVVDGAGVIRRHIRSHFLPARHVRLALAAVRLCARAGPAA